MPDQKCPKCGSKMYLRKAKQGPHEGDVFIGCGNYPTCKHILQLTCPICNAPMVIRLATTGKGAGKYFWGCSNYPECKETVAIYQ
jgi:ssDNA-binding Zn-finger/Zn-ribbon topoisomerase 1